MAIGEDRVVATRMVRIRIVGIYEGESGQGERIKFLPNYCHALDFDKCTRLRFFSDLSLHGGESWALPRCL
jgi:hypothetical protein